MSTETPRTALIDQPEVGSYFVATYPPFSVWSAEAVERDALPALQAAPDPAVPLGLYLHIPFCRKRCHFCYFRVYTDKNAQEVGRYLDVLAREWELYARQPALAGRPLNFVYFGGGTPSFLSTQQLQGLVSRITAVTPWTDAEEITFECEPGTLTEHKLNVIRSMGVTRLSLGVENFDDRILELNGRAHRSPEIGQAYRFARSLGFPQINIDLIAGMLGETEENWQRCVQQTVELEPDSVTIYQMELPFNTTITKDLLKGSHQLTGSLADWPTKRRWVENAFATLERAGYHVGSAYTAVKDPSRTRFTYRDRLWQGADMAGLGVASFGHVNGVHMQNLDTWETYSEAIDARPAAAGPRVSADRGRAHAPGTDPAAEARTRRADIFPAQVQRRHPAAVRRSVRFARGGRLPRARHRGSRGADARRPDARRRAPAALLPPATHGHSLYLERVLGCSGSRVLRF